MKFFVTYKSERIGLLGEVNRRGLGLWDEERTKTPLLECEKKRKLKNFGETCVVRNLKLLHTAFRATLINSSTDLAARRAYTSCGKSHRICSA